MNLLSGLVNPWFWAFTTTAAMLLAAIWPALYLWKRNDASLDDLRRVFWSWVLYVAAIHPAMLLGQQAFGLVVGLIALFACKEFARATGLYQDWLFTGLVYVSILLSNFVAQYPGYDVFMASPIYAVAIFCVLPVLRNQAEGMLQRVALSVMAFVYFGFFLAHLSLFASIPDPSMSYAYLLFLLYGTATAHFAGWLVGRTFGKHRLLGQVSPEWTLEGALATLAWATSWSLIVGQWLPDAFSWIAVLLAALLFGIMGPAGELVMQYILHDLGLKPVTESTRYVPFLALNHLHRLIFVAPLFFRVVHWFDPTILVRN